MIIGLTGRNAAGKGEVADYLKSKGFAYFSLSDVLRETLRDGGEEVSRENLVKAGRRLRKQHGTGYLARQILSRLEPDQNYVVDSFRHPDEVAVFRQAPEFYLLEIAADEETRFQRIRRRDRENDPETLTQFQALEAAEATSETAGGQDLDKTRALADFRIQNDGSLEDLHSLLGKLLQEKLAALKRPDWDTYFMRIAQVASLRSNCIKRKVAALIVKDRRVISTGYNGTPRGTRNCFEGGCPRCNNLADSGTKLEECLCSHGEENAITQAAYHGVSVKDGTLYTTFAPCLMCTKMIINAGIREVVYNAEYPLNASSFSLLKEAGVDCRKLEVE